MYDVGASHLNHQGAAHTAAETVGAAVETVKTAAAGAVQELTLFATRTCPNCKQAEKLLSDAGIAFKKLLAEENAELVNKLQIRQAPTLVDEKGEKLVGLNAVRQFISGRKS